MPSTTMTMIRDLYDDSGELIGETDLTIDIVFLEEQRQTFGSPGSPEEISIGDCIDSAGNKIELTPCEEDYVYENLHNYLKQAKDQAEHEQHRDE